MSVPPASDEERQLAAQAQQEFERNNYDACMATLSKLNGTRGPDPKVLHNKALVEYCKSKWTRTDEFQRSLRDVCSKVSLNLDNVDSLDDADQCVVFYNYAVILYHLRQYRRALHIVDKLSQFIEPMEDGLSRKIMFLLVELYIQTYQPEKAMGMIGYMEKTLAPKAGGQHSPEKEAKDTPANDDALKSTLSQYKARCFMMWKSMKSCKREVKGLMIANNGMTAPLIYLKANTEFLRGNYRKAIKVLNSAPAGSGGGRDGSESLAVLYHNNLAVIHLQMRKQHLAALYLRRALDENARATADLCKIDLHKSLNGVALKRLGLSRHYELLYNMGVSMLHCGQPEPAFDCLIETTQRFQANPRLWLRLAECCVMAHKASNEEERRLEKKLAVIQGSVGSGLHRKVILGAGIDAANTLSNESAALPSTTLEFASLCLKNAHLLLPADPADGPVKDASSAGSDDNAPPGDARPGEQLLVPAPPSPPLRGPEVAALRCSVLAAAAYVSLCLHDYVLARSYSHQLLAQPRLSPAHRYVGQLYKSEALVALDRIADAVELLNPESVTDISLTAPAPPSSSSSSSSSSSQADGQRGGQQAEDKGDKNGGDKDQEAGENKEGSGGLYPWSPRDIPSARAIMQYNLAVAHAVRGEYDKALNNLNKSSQHIGQPYPAQMYFLKVYLELMEGRRKAALGTIKDNFGHVTPNRVSP